MVSNIFYFSIYWECAAEPETVQPVPVRSFHHHLSRPWLGSGKGPFSCASHAGCDGSLRSCCCGKPVRWAPCLHWGSNYIISITYGDLAAFGVGLPNIAPCAAATECHHPNWRTHIFQRGRYTTNQIVNPPRHGVRWKQAAPGLRRTWRRRFSKSLDISHQFERIKSMGPYHLALKMARHLKGWTISEYIFFCDFWCENKVG